MLKWFAGIGSRECPNEAILLLKRYSSYLCGRHNYGLRSGGANGADSACEAGCNEVNGRKEIFLPFKGFNKNKSDLYIITPEALKMAEEYHPAWNRLTKTGKLLMARNCYQVLGPGLDDPVDFILCWTKDGEASGGTGQALRIAKDREITIYNIYHQLAREKMATYAPV